MKQFEKALVPLWVIVTIVALPQLSETIYTPSLPDIARALGVTDGLAEGTLTIYLVGFAVGVALWGNLSDCFGRKRPLLAGLAIYLLACVACFLAGSIEMLMTARFFQAFGASTGSVLGQAIARDSIPAEDRGKAFSTISIAMAFAPALGPVLGGYCAESFGWPSVFLVLLALGSFIVLQLLRVLPETLPPERRRTNPFKLIPSCAKRMVADRRVLGFGFIVGTVNGIIFAYFGEGPFFFINILGLKPSHFGVLSLFIALPLALGGTISRRMHSWRYSGEQIITRGALVSVGGAVLFSTCSYAAIIDRVYGWYAVGLSAALVSIVICGLAMMIPNCLGAALERYSDMAGTAASLFGCYYYVIVSLMTFLMAALHDGSVRRMPIFFLGSTMAVLFVQWRAIQRPAANTMGRTS